MSISREIEIDAPPEEVWEALATDEGRERWLAEDEREVLVEAVEEPRAAGLVVGRRGRPGRAWRSRSCRRCRARASSCVESAPRVPARRRSRRAFSAVAA